VKIPWSEKSTETNVPRSKRSTGIKVLESKRFSKHVLEHSLIGPFIPCDFSLPGAKCPGAEKSCIHLSSHQISVNWNLPNAFRQAN